MARSKRLQKVAGGENELRRGQLTRHTEMEWVPKHYGVMVCRDSIEMDNKEYDNKD